MRLLVDMNLSPRWVGWLQSAGFDAVHWSQIGSSDAPDRELMGHASRHGFILLTQDLDFSSILAASQESRPSVVQIRADDNSPEAIGLLLLDAIRQTADELGSGAIVTLEPGRRRVRILPL